MTEHMLEGFIKLKQAQYDTLTTAGSVTLADGTVITYDDHKFYLVQENGTIYPRSSGGTIDVDSFLSTVSTNPVQNKVITAALYALDYADTAVANKYVSAVSETDGVIAVTRENLPVGWKTIKVIDGTGAEKTTKVIAVNPEDNVAFVEGANITITPDATGKKLTIAAAGGAVVDVYSPTGTDAVSGKAVKAALDTLTKATTTADGLMSKEDKVKLDNLDTTIQNAINALDVADTAVANQFVTSVSETDGKITVTRAAIDKVTTAADGLMSKEDKVKLDGIEDDAQKNVQSDWNQTNAALDDFIKNKPTLDEAAYETKAGVLDALTKEIIIAKLGYTPEDAANKSATKGYAPLEDGKVPETYLPAYISEVKEYPDEASLPAAGDASYLYYAQAEQTTWRWTGTTYSQIASSLSLGETASTAFAGNKGKIAYDHAMQKGAEFATGLYKFSTNAEGHVTNAVAVTKTDIEAITGSLDGVTYTGGTGINITGGVVKNTGVTAIAEGTTDGTVQVTTNGVAADVAVHGLGTAAYVDTKATLTATDNTDVPTSKAVADYVDDKLDDYLKTADEKSYTIERSADDKKIVLKEDGTIVSTIDDKGNVQANWAQTDTTADSYIQNKPDIYTKTETNDLLDDKVDKETGKGLSSNDFTDALKTKLEGIADEADKTVVDTAITATSTNPVTSAAINTALADKVDKETGKGLYPDTDKTKLAGIEDSAEVNQNAISKITVNGVTVASTVKEDTFVLAEGANVTLTADPATKTITIASAGGGSGTGTYDDTAIKGRVTALETKTNGMYTKAEVDGLLADKADEATTLAGYGITDAYTKTAADAKFAEKATTLAGYGITDAYKKTQVDDLLDGKADKATTLAGYGITDAYKKTEVYTKTETDDLLDDKADKATTLAGYGITDAYKKTETYTQTEVDALFTDKPTGKLPVYGLAKSTDGTKIYLTKDGTKVEPPVVDATATAGESVTYSISLSGNVITLTSSTGASSTITIPAYTLENGGTNADKIIFKKDGTALSTYDNVSGVKGSEETDYRTGKVNITKANIGLANVENKTPAEIRDELTKAEVVKALGYTPEDVAKKGVAGGYAELGTNGKVPTSQLPSYLSEIKEYANQAAFPAAGDKSIIYVAQDTLIQYRWTGSAYVAISGGGSGGGIDLGTNHTQAYYGDYGQTAYEHATETGKAAANALGLYKIATTAQGHVASVTAVAQADITALNIATTDKATATADGLMSKQDKAKLDDIDLSVITNAEIDAICV